MSVLKNDNNAENRVLDFVSRLSNEEAMLLVLKKELYEGQWEIMVKDLKNRLEGKPYIFKLANRIMDDMKRIERLKAFETEQQVNLADYINHSS